MCEFKDLARNTKIFGTRLSIYAHICPVMSKSVYLNPEANVFSLLRSKNNQDLSRQRGRARLYLGSMQVPMINAIVSSLKLKISHSPLEDGEKRRISSLVDEVPHEVLQELCDTAPRKLSAATLMYICCFIAGVDAAGVAAIFGIEVSSVYRTRHRIRRMFPENKIIPF